MERVKVVIISGSVGVGKTSVAEEMADILKIKSIPYAYIDLDNLAHAYPRPKDDPFHSKLALKNLAAVWKNLKKVGAKFLIIPRVFESRDELKDYQKAIPNADIILVGLRAKLSTTHKRLRKRGGSSLRWHLDRAAVLTKQFDEKQIEDFVIKTENKSPSRIAKEIIQLITEGLAC